MKKLLLSMFTALLLTFPSMAQAEMDMHSKADMASSTPKLYAALFYADWCGSCKILDPKVIEARNQSNLDNKDILFITFDLTDAKTKHQSALLASALGLSDYFTKNAGKTGYLGLFNPETKELVKKIGKDMDTAQISTALMTNVK